MITKNPAFDAYIFKAQPFAQPILEYLRNLVHDTCPLTEEKIKWGMPHFDYRGEMMCNMAAFKHHCAFGFWKASLLSNFAGMNISNATGMGNLGKIASLKDLPPKNDLKSLIQEAMLLNEQGIKVTKANPKATHALLTEPIDWKTALQENEIAAQVWSHFAPSHRKEYLQWIVDAKTTNTRQRRIDQAIAWIAEGKHRNWKYEK